MAPPVVSKQLRKKYFNRCDWREPLAPDDERNVDVDTVNTEARGRNWVDTLADRIEISESPVCEFFTGLPGSGKSTELRRLAVRLSDPEGANLLPVLIAAEDFFELSNPIDIPDVLIAILYRADQTVLEAEGKDPEDALKDGRFKRFWHWLTTTEVEIKGVEAGVQGKVAVPGSIQPGDNLLEASTGAKVVLDLRSNKPLREQIRARVAAHMTTFLEQVGDALKELEKRAKRRGRAGLLIIFDSLEKLRGISTNWQEVLMSAERIFAGGAPYLQLPVHVVYTLPTAIVFRLNLSVHFLPMLKLYDRKGKRAAGFDAAREIILKRVPSEHLSEFLGPTSWEDRIQRLIEWSGGYPREIVRMLQGLIAERTVDEAIFRRHLADNAETYRRTIEENAFPWLVRVHRAKQLMPDDNTQRATIDMMLQNNIVLRYHNEESWVDIHPAIRSMPQFEEHLKRLEGK